MSFVVISLTPVLSLGLIRCAFRMHFSLFQDPISFLNGSIFWGYFFAFKVHSISKHVRFHHNLQSLYVTLCLTCTLAYMGLVINVALQII